MNELVRQNQPGPLVLSKAHCWPDSSFLRGPHQSVLEREGKPSCSMNIHSFTLLSGPWERSKQGLDLSDPSRAPDLPFFSLLPSRESGAFSQLLFSAFFLSCYRFHKASNLEESQQQGVAMML